MFDLIHAHTSFLGHTGYANHSREFFTALNKLIQVRVRNFAHVSDLSYLTREQRDMVIHQTWAGPPHEVGKPFNSKDYKDILNIVLNETNHYYFYDSIPNPKIGYNVWESTRQPDQYFKKLFEFDQLWVPTKWQRDCSIEQGYPADRVFVVPEAVNPEFFPESIPMYTDDRFKFIFFGRWDYRKSVTEVIKAFLEEFKDSEPVDLILSADNPFSVDGLKTTEERLKYHNLDNPKIKVKHNVPWKEYVKYIKSGHCFLSCARGEGWNIPLIEAMASGTPAIYSDWGAQLEFAEGKGHPVKIVGEVPAKFGEGSSFAGGIPGNYCEPDFKDLKRVMRFVYENYEKCKEKALIDSKLIRQKYTWTNAALTAYDIITKFWSDYYIPRRTNFSQVDFTWKNKQKRETVVSIRDGYTGLNYYRCNIDVIPGTNYWVRHGYNVKHKIFELTDRNTGELLFSETNNEGKYNLEELDKEHHLKNYSEVISNEATIALPLYEIFVDEVYNHKLCNITKGDVVVDIGSSLGFFALYAYYQGCKVCYSFEPINKLYNAVTTKLNNIPVLKFENKAVDNFTGKAKIFIPTQESIGASIYDPSKKYNKPQTSEICDVVNFMEIVIEKGIQKIDYLKLDCEGSEYNIIETIPDDYLKNNIRKIAMEFHNNTEGQLKVTLDRLESLGFEVNFREGSSISGDLGVVYAWKKFNFDEFIKPYEEDLKRTGLSRYNFYKYVIPKLVEKQKPLYIIETGTMWSDLKDNMGAFTLVFSDLIKNWTGGELTTIDISEENINKCKASTRQFSEVIKYVHSDSVKYLESLSDEKISKIDLFYLDSYDLNVTNQEPSANHHLNELKAIYNRLNPDTIISVDDNYLPGTEIQWNWLDKDGNVTSSEQVKTGNNVIGKGSKVNEFLLRNGWRRIFEYDVLAQNNVFYYERIEKLPKESVIDILNNFYLSRSTSKQKREQFDIEKITNADLGLGDTMMLTPFTKYKVVDSLSTSFPTLMMYNQEFKNPIFTETKTSIDISELAKYDWGSGHAIHRIAKAIGFPADLKPKGRLDIKKQTVKGRIGYHVQNVSNNQHSLKNENLRIFREFMNENNYEFVDLSSISNLRILIETLKDCEFFIGINSGPMHVAAALDIKSIIIVNQPNPSELYLPKITETEIPESEWLYPQNVHLHTKGSNELVPKFNKVNLQRAIEGKIYPYFLEDYLDIQLDESKTEYNINCNFVNGAFVEIKGNDRSLFKIEFIDKDKNEIVHSTKIRCNHWTKTNRKYYTNWLVKIYKDGNLLAKYNLNLKGKRVYIHLDSKSIGDTLAWFPYVEGFRQLHDCKVICSTFWNDLFRKNYPEIEFVNPGTRVDNILSMYTIGWWDKDKDDGHLRPSNPRTKPLQQTCSDILGLPYKEIVPKIYVKDRKRKIKDKYICIATMSTSGCKIWLRHLGWQNVIDYLNSLGYKVVVVQREPTDLKNIIDMTRKDDLQESINLIYNCEFFIGLASGLSWVAWALGKKSIMIAGFTETYTEYQKDCYRVINKNVCYGCWNDPDSFPFDKSWEWCPRKKNFECSREISFEMVKDKIDLLIKDKN